MWQRLTERARRVVFHAQEEAQKLGSRQVGTEHILLGILACPSTAKEVLLRLGVSVVAVHLAVAKETPPAESRPSTDMTLTPRGKRAIDLAYDEARTRGHNYIGTEHLLAGLVREGDGLGGRILKRMDVTLGSVWQTVAEIVANAPKACKDDVVTDEVESPQRWLLLTHLLKLTGESQRAVMGEAIIEFALLDGTDEAARLMEALGIDEDSLAKGMRASLLGAYEEDEIQLGPPFSAYLAHADAQRKGLGHDQVRPGHLLLAVLMAGGPAAEVLRSCGLESGSLRERLKSFYLAGS